VGVLELHQAHRALLCPVPHAQFLHLGEIEGGTAFDRFGDCCREGAKTLPEFMEKEQEEEDEETGEGEAE